MRIGSGNLSFRELNEKIKLAAEEVFIDECCGQRFIATGLKEKNITINGTPGNALGAYLDGAVITVNGNAQDAVGDTMNDGKIIIHGSAGDALGYAMRGGSIFVKGDAGYRTGIHMKQYNEKKPVIVVGGKSGSFLGEYLAGGILIVLGLGAKGQIPVGNFAGTGMHGGKIFIRTEKELGALPPQVSAEQASKEDMQEIKQYLSEYSSYFNVNEKEFIYDKFYILRANQKNPYKQLYTAN